MKHFIEGQRVIFRESETGPAEPGIILDVFEPDEAYPNGGTYSINLDDGTTVIAYWTELANPTTEV